MMAVQVFLIFYLRLPEPSAPLGACKFQKRLELMAKSTK
ncbi:hypothetical protein RintRC_3616 [Richelia intracellularis]|nr:hypothetical protein RintRC_3616 [Richelia intracellularis]